MVCNRVLLGEEDVLGFHIAMHDAAGVGHGQRARDLSDDAHRASDRHGSSALHLLGQAAAVEELEHQERDAVWRAPCVDRLDDVRVAQGPCGAALVHEATHDLSVRRVLRVQELDRDAAPDPLVHGFVDRAHAAGADPPHQAVALGQDATEHGIYGAFGRRTDELVLASHCPPCHPT